MSNNYKLYTQKVAEMRATRRSTPHPLRAQLDELLAVVQRCEHLWKIEERIENSLG
jgi:hypothetical protein